MTTLGAWLVLLLVAPAPGKAKAEPGAGAEARPDPDAPPKTSYQVELEIRKREGAIAVDRKRGIALLEEFIDKHAGSRAMPEALYRLAALYWERSQERFLSEMKSWADTVDGCKKSPEACPAGPPPEPRLDFTRSQVIYKRLIGEYPSFRKLDTVRYLYGFSLRDQGKLDEAQAQFRAIIDKHPTSTFVPDAWLAVGDHRFYDDNDFRTAQAAYGEVLRFPQSDAYAMALFKSAWCHWKLGEREAAIRRFKEVLDQAADPTQGEEGRKRLADLREEALEYLVQVLTEDETQTPKEIHDFLASIGGQKYSRHVLVRLAEAYEAQTRYDKSVPTYRFLIGLDGNHEDNAEFQIHVFVGVRGTGRVPEAYDALGELHTRYGPKSAWGKAHPRQSIAAHERSEQLLYDFARGIHENAQAVEAGTKVPDKERYALAVRGYEDYIARFPANPRAVELSYFAGDVYLFKLAELERAGDSYLRVGESAPVGRMHRDALVAAVSAYERALQQAPETPTADAKPEAKPENKPDDGPDAKPDHGPDATTQAGADTIAAGEPAPQSDHDRLEGKFIRAVELFAALFPADEEIPAVVYKLGDFLFRKGDFDAAAQRFGRVVVDYPSSQQAPAAGDRILESLGRAKDYDNIELWAAKLKGAPGFSARDEQQRLDRIIVDSLMKQGETLADRGYYERAANYYLRVATEYPKQERSALALNNAGAALERAGRGVAATAAYERLAEDYPGTPQAAEATLIVAHVYENIARYEAAAQRYDELDKRYPQHPRRADALYNAGILYQALGKDREAIVRYQRYAERYPDREDAQDVELRAGEVHEHRRDHKSAAAAYRQFLKRHARSPRAVEANMRLGRSLIALGDSKAAEKSLQAAATAKGTEGRERIAAAEARYLQGELIQREFQAAKLDPRPAKLGASLEKKAKLLATAKAVYLDVVAYGAAEWSTAALFRVGESYEKFANDLRNYPVPKNLSTAEQDAYVEQLNTFALAFEEQAIEAYRSGFSRAMELKIYNAHTRRIREALGRLSKQEFPPIDELGTDPAPAEGGAGSGRALGRLRR